MKIYGLVGYPLSHSFSQKYFSDKFKSLGITDSSYELFDFESIEQIKELKLVQGLRGFNITIPYKEAVIPYLDSLDESARLVGAVNVVKNTTENRWVGYNSDYYGFKKSLDGWLPGQEVKALVLGTGGASKAVVAALDSLHIDYKLVSREEGEKRITYEYLKKKSNILVDHQLVINTTPLGTYPHVNSSPEIDYLRLTTQHFLYDLVYNPECSQFLDNGRKQGCQIKNGLEMLELQAEKSWEIWNQ